MTQALALTEIVKRFPSGEAPAVDRISFEVNQGEFLVLLGPSGCGKSTVLRMIAGLIEPDGGEIRLGDRVVNSWDQGYCLPTEKRNIGLVFQSYAIWPHMTVFENIAYPLRVRRLRETEIRDRVNKTVELIGLTGFEHRPATQLSGGQQQRVALARALVFEPELLLLDEPLSNLDAKLRAHMRTELKVLQKKTGITMVFVTHDQDESMALADRIIVMNRGRIEQVGSPSEIYERPRNRFVSEFIGSINVFSGTLQQHSGDVANVQAKGMSLLCRADAAPAIREGQAVLVSIRPEKLKLSDTRPPHDANVWEGQIAANAYYGTRREYHVDIGGRLVTIETPAHVEHLPGAWVFVSCEVADLALLPDDVLPGDFTRGAA